MSCRSEWREISRFLSACARLPNERGPGLVEAPLPLVISALLLCEFDQSWLQHLPVSRRIQLHLWTKLANHYNPNQIKLTLISNQFAFLFFF